MTIYFAKDGNYGEAYGMFTIDTTAWNELDWNQIEEAGDADRVSVAMEIAKKYA
jgi:hypothetical protein